MTLSKTFSLEHNILMFIFEIIIISPAITVQL